MTKAVCYEGEVVLGVCNIFLYLNQTYNLTLHLRSVIYNRQLKHRMQRQRKEKSNNLVFVTLVGVFVELAHPRHDLRAVGARPHLLVVVGVVLVVAEDLHRGEVVVAAFAVEPESDIITVTLSYLK